MGPPALELPDPALPPEEETFARHNRAWRHSRLVPNPSTTPSPRQSDSRRNDAYTVGTSNSPHKSRTFFRPRRASVTGAMTVNRPRFVQRIFSAGADSPLGDVPLEAYRELDTRQAEFFTFLDKELDKIESFYRMKEAQASARLQLLRTQLHEMRDRRVQEIREDQMAREEAARHHRLLSADHHSHSEYGTLDTGKSRLNTALRWLKPIESAIGVGPARIGKTSKSLQQNTSPLAMGQQYTAGPERPEGWGDFTRRQSHPDDVPYRAAKRKLKLALQEFYRGLELLKSYALTNRTAFRKINKKYDKAVKARPTQRYMSERVNKSWFVQSEVLEGQIVAVEDLYARYFERGNHKLAVGKLRSKTSHGDYSGSVFRNGLMLASGVVFGIQGVVYGAEHLYSDDPTVHIRTSYLLQVSVLEIVLWLH